MLNFILFRFDTDSLDGALGDTVWSRLGKYLIDRPLIIC